MRHVKLTKRNRRKTWHISTWVFWLHQALNTKLWLWLILFILTTGYAEAVERDKALHFGLSFAGQTVCSKVIRQSRIFNNNEDLTDIGCAIGVLALGAATEAGAFGVNEPEAGDMVANGLGIGAAFLIFKW